ncbi:MAG: GNAT family N-acetyltransferase [Bdellovibrionales bacterium]
MKSLVRKTDQIFLKSSSQIVDKDNYSVIKTPTNPGFHWGNYLYLKKPPELESLKQWIECFDEEFKKGLQHYNFVWASYEPISSSSKRAMEEFGFKYYSAVGLMAKEITFPTHFNSDITIRSIQKEEDWEAVIQNQLACADPIYLDENYEPFKRTQFDVYRELVNNGEGEWFGAFLGDELSADLGIFTVDNLARFQSVGTNPRFRKKGICASLVFHAGNQYLSKSGIDTLVMEADENYHAARIYESVGFKGTEHSESISWWSSLPALSL